MVNFDVPTLCIECKTWLKRQVIGSNVFYYCKSCGCMSSDICLSGGSVNNAQNSFAQRASSVTELEVSVNAQNAIMES
ncbi:hypothetical protein MSSAC_3625 [Methanosarcina siciliae C2J]|uniref:Uncharacterized protein n=1 Tax=Methanosarcina siciliae C2J TaxID=1434118 RepID=A0A0E3PTE2_9EURY|nr:hypothetical protein [Methanosarcina siciliae]AKB38215.1 hypothetical protein MSSAC_3625 [Methanosarcina siciliae C2J]